MSTVSVEVVYRGIFQKTLAQRICRGIVLAARKEGKIGIAFGRYGDSPERNGIPAKQFAVVADDQEELEASMSKYEPKEVDVTIAVDDALCKGIESWAWYGLQPINKLLKPNGTLLITSMNPPEELLKHVHKKESEYNIAIIKGAASFSGLWVYKDDHTDVRILGALPKVCPQLISLNSMEEAIRDQWKEELKVASARKSFERVTPRKVTTEEGNSATPYSFELPPWHAMKEGIVVPAIEKGGFFRDSEGGFQPQRNPYFKKFTTRTMRPVIDFELCTKCTLCWLQCPDSCFDVTPERFYDANMEACCGCGVCEDVCPEAGCITMINEAAFGNNDSQYEMWMKDKEAYKIWLQEKLNQKIENRAHGFKYKGQYQEQIAEMKEEILG
ncbi:MAG: (4Fe-4S)-binding protein [Candidatus Tectomicrobia bacterium]|nr:(4Fe-4S)-binding protein [Candidatus Tectomicrobia bacterium]